MKKYKVIYSPHALTDLENAVYYYNEQQKGLGKRFAAQVQLALTSIKKNPHFASTIDEDTRTVLIAAIYSTHQQPLGE